MRLGDRLKQQGREPSVAAVPAAGAAGTPGPPVAPVVRLAPPEPNPADTRGPDPLGELRQRAQEALFGRLGVRLFDSSLGEEQLRSHVLQEIARIMEGESAPLTTEERQQLVDAIADDVLGHGPIERFLADPTVSEIMVNADGPIYVERNGKLEPTTARFFSLEHVRRVIERIVGQVGRRIDESSPMVDARLPDGSRVNAVIPPLAVDGPSLTIRKFSKDPFRVEDLISFGTFTPDVAALLAGCVQGRLNVLVTGGTGSGKTTLLNVLSGAIPSDERIVTIEDAVELQLRRAHVVRLEARPANIEGKGQVTIRDLVRNSLRMRPDRIIVGEVRGAEALDMLQAMNTGHEGSLCTVHANTPRDALARVETMVLMAGMDLPSRAIREQIASALDVIVHIARLRDGSRRVTHVSEITGMEGQVITLQDIFTFDYGAGIGPDGRYLGSLRPTGIRPAFASRLADVGVPLPAALFGTPDLLAARSPA